MGVSEVAQLVQLSAGHGTAGVSGHPILIQAAPLTQGGVQCLDILDSRKGLQLFLTCWKPGYSLIYPQDASLAMC